MRRSITSNLEEIDHQARVITITRASIHVACSEEVDPTYGCSHLAAFESLMKAPWPVGTRTRSVKDQ
jgi:hypothetical protein